MSGYVGLRVVRGPHWKWQSQDGGEGGLGTVVMVTRDSSSATRAIVRWDTGMKETYRMGEGSAFDLRIFDNAACGIRHASTTCDACNENGVVGIRWKCRKCNDYDLCTACYMADKHDISHAFVRITEPSSSPIGIPPRQSSSKMEAKGICPGATVTRSSDWKWGDQDGGHGQTGVVTEITNWPGDRLRNAVRVYWNATGHSDMYRFGFDGKLDVVATVCKRAGQYYPEHLPNLGQPEIAPTPSAAVPGQRPFKIGDRVTTNVPVHVLKELQEGHGGWIPEMSTLVGQIGKVSAYTDKGNIQVEFESNKKYILNPAVLKKFTMASVGDIVRIISDDSTAKARQEGHGGWNDKMIPALGKVGKVVARTSNGDLKIDTGGSAFIWNPACCIEPTNADKEAYAAAALSHQRTSVSESKVSREEPSGAQQASKSSILEVGDVVTIIDDEEKIHQLQDGHGGWINEMAEALGKTGKVVKIDGDSIRVHVAGREWWFNPACCVKASASDDDDDGEDSRAALTVQLLNGLVAAQLQVGLLQAVAALQHAEPRFNVGDLVRIDRDVSKVVALQRGHGGWNDMMLMSLGKAGKVIEIDSDGDVKVNTGLLTWTFNPDCLEPITEAEAGECLIC